MKAVRIHSRKNDLISAYALALIFLAAIIALAIQVSRAPQNARPAISVISIADWRELMEQEEDRQITKALERQGYFFDAIPLDYIDQDRLQTACEEFGVPYALALGLIQQETQFRNVTGDGGTSFGYMQVKLSCHRERMERIGADDLMEPLDNFRTGCHYLAELLERYQDPRMALMAYNMGPGGAARLWQRGVYTSGYAEAVCENAGAWEDILEEV